MLNMHPFPTPSCHKLCHPSIYPKEILEQDYIGTFTWIITNPFLLLLCFCLGIMESEVTSVFITKRMKKPLDVGVHCGLFHYQELTQENLSHLHPKKLRWQALRNFTLGEKTPHLSQCLLIWVIFFFNHIISGTLWNKNKIPVPTL